MRKLILLLLALVTQLSAAPVKIMPMGDSITAGYTDNPEWKVPFEYGYRSRLYTLLTKAGYDFQFVGGSSEPFNNVFGDPTHDGRVAPELDLRPLMQNGHRGYAGKDIGFFNSNAASFIGADQPDVILLMIGLNGISASSPAQLDSLVDTIFTAKPDVKLIVAQITPLINFNPDIFNYNAYIRDTLVPKYSGLGRSISTVDQYKHFLTKPWDATSIDPSHFSNGINHPDHATYDLMAATWFAGLQAILPTALRKGADLKENPATKQAVVKTATAASEPPSVTGESNGDEMYFANDVSKTDLLNGLPAANVEHGGWNLLNSSSPDALNDGVHGRTGIPVEGAWSETAGSVVPLRSIRARATAGTSRASPASRRG